MEEKHRPESELEDHRMTRIILIAVAAVLAYFAVGLLVLKLLWIFGQVDRLDICEEEQVMIVMVWPLYLIILLPV